MSNVGQLVRLCLLRADIGGCAHDGIGLGQAGGCAFKKFGNAEIGQEEVALRVDQGVGRFEVAMNDAIRAELSASASCVKRRSISLSGSGLPLTIFSLSVPGSRYA